MPRAGRTQTPASSKLSPARHDARKPPQKALPQPVGSTAATPATVGTSHVSPVAAQRTIAPSGPRRRAITAAPAAANIATSSAGGAGPTMEMASASFGDTMCAALQKARSSASVKRRSADVYGSMESRPPRGADVAPGEASAAARSCARCARSTRRGCTPRWKAEAARNDCGSDDSDGRSVTGSCGVRQTCAGAVRRLPGRVADAQSEAKRRFVTWRVWQERPGVLAGGARLRASAVALQHLPGARRGRARQPQQPGAVHARRHEPRRARRRQVVSAHAGREPLRGQASARAAPSKARGKARTTRGARGCSRSPKQVWGPPPPRHSMALLPSGLMMSSTMSVKQATSSAASGEDAAARALAYRRAAAGAGRRAAYRAPGPAAGRAGRAASMLARARTVRV